jgi:hypothetical protein
LLPTVAAADGIYHLGTPRAVGPEYVNETKVVENDLIDGSVLPLRANVADLWASNLLTAQLPANCSYCAMEADSLPLSIDAVLRAIGLEQSIAGLAWCDRTNCTLANSQSTIAIDDRVSVTITPAYINFGEVPVGSSETISLTVTNTPEPSFWMMLVAGMGMLWVGLLGWPPRKAKI